MTAVSSPVRPTDPRRAARRRPAAVSNSPGATTMTSVPVTSAALVASSANSANTTATFAPASFQAYATSPALSSGFIGTTMAPSRRIA